MTAKTFRVSNIGTIGVVLDQFIFNTPPGVRHIANLTNFGGPENFVGNNFTVTTPLLVPNQSKTFTVDHEYVSGPRGLRHGNILVVTDTGKISTIGTIIAVNGPEVVPTPTPTPAPVPVPTTTPVPVPTTTPVPAPVPVPVPTTTPVPAPVPVPVPTTTPVPAPVPVPVPVPTTTPVPAPVPVPVPVPTVAWMGTSIHSYLGSTSVGPGGSTTITVIGTPTPSGKFPLGFPVYWRLDPSYAGKTMNNMEYASNDDFNEPTSGVAYANASGNATFTLTAKSSFDFYLKYAQVEVNLNPNFTGLSHSSTFYLRSPNY